MQNGGNYAKFNWVPPQPSSLWGEFAGKIQSMWIFGEYDRVYKGINVWLTQQEHLELDKASDRHMLYHFAGPHSAQMKKWNYGKVRYFVPIKIIEEC